ncbi:MAG: 2-oxo acid dehydrogenase subunit E2 [Gemmataceae bacterium]|nr:2-oxo acid dehydrogenase subunit E2 [Gemmataceae bacterium]MDW8242489.1 hypothetical protein [Thermogemmata sp.]
MGIRRRTLPWSRPRVYVNDLLHFARQVPSIPVQRECYLGPLLAVRSSLPPPRPPWYVLFIKAYALVAQEMPPLRRAYCAFPRPHLVEYDRSVAAVAVERDWEGEKVVLTVRLKHPERLPLSVLTSRLRWAQSAPLEQVKDFRRVLWLSGLPRPLRRLLWWFTLNCSRYRGNACGTFGLSSYSALGAESLHPLSPLTTTLNYGVIDSQGNTRVRIVYDHRVLDGATVARALHRLEEILNTHIRTELLTGKPAETKITLPVA